MGLVFLFSASQGNIETTIKQSFFVLFGLILMFAVSQPDPDFYKNNSLLFFLISVLLLCELFISGYHTLSTFGIIEYTGCESATLPTDINQLKEALLNDKLVVTCSNANLKFFGIPLSFYNTLFSTFFLLIIILNAYKKKK